MTQHDLFSTARPLGSAVLSLCEKYRYRLSRDLGNSGRRVAFIMLNPSTADHTVDDPTITRCTQFAHSWGFGWLDVCNLFAWRSTDMRALGTVADPIGREDLGVGNNDRHIAEIAAAAGRIVFAWGNGHRSFQHLLDDRESEVTQLVVRHAKVLPVAFRMTKAARPEHPLYQRADAQLTPFHGAELLKLGMGGGG